MKIWSVEKIHMNAIELFYYELTYFLNKLKNA